MKAHKAHVQGRAAASVAVLVLAVGACGGGAKSKSTPAHTNATRTTSSSRSVGVATSRMTATLTAADHSPVVGKNWPYSVRVTTAGGKPLDGTVRVQFTFGGRVVGTDHPPVHQLKNGAWHDTLQFPRAAVGFPLAFQVVVHTSAGSVTLNWPVSVKS